MRSDRRGAPPSATAVDTSSQVDNKSVCGVRCIIKKIGSRPSLNDCLHISTPMLKHIPDVLILLRTNNIAIKADTETALLMVGTGKADRDVLRCLWLNDVHSEQPEVVSRISLEWNLVSPLVCSYSTLLLAITYSNAKSVLPIL